MATSIEWTDETWNPVVGCEQISPGCAHCYAKEQWDRRHKAHKAGKPMAAQYARPFEIVRTMPERLLEPLKWRAPRRVFVNSVSDLFHADVPFEFIDRVFAVMAHAQRHTFQILTKRAERMREYVSDTAHTGLGFPDDVCTRVARAMEPIGHDVAPATVRMNWPPPNVWLGVSVENQHFADERIPQLLQTPAAVRFVSAEPLLGPVDLGLTTATCNCCKHFPSRWASLTRPVTCDFPLALLPENRDRIAKAGCYRTESNRHGALSVPTVSGALGLRPSEFTALPSLDWVIVGGESGAVARPFELSWCRSVVEQCQAAGVPVFVKQLGRWPLSNQNENEHGGRYWVELCKGPGGLNPTGEYGLENAGRSKGGDMAEWPADLRVRQFPEVRQ